MAFIRKPVSCKRAGFYRKAGGFSLVEMAVVIFVIGVLTAGIITIVSPIMKEARLRETDAKLQKLARAIDSYVIQNNRLPCPAVPFVTTANPPFGFEFNSGAAGSAVPANCGATAATWEGIVPFKTLGIPADWIRDSAGNLISYAISPGFALDPQDATRVVHARCRSAEWYASQIFYEKDMAVRPAPVLFHSNPEKARFCCSGDLRNNDLVINDRSGNSQMAFPRQVAGIVYASGTSYDVTTVSYPNPMTPNGIIDNDDRVTAPVYVLVSHGNHGGGSFNANAGAVTHYPITADATPAENVNAADNARTFFDIPVIQKDNDEMTNDDVILWRTQDMIFSSQGQSCSLP